MTELGWCKSVSGISGVVSFCFGYFVPVSALFRQRFGLRFGMNCLRLQRCFAFGAKICLRDLREANGDRRKRLGNPGIWCAFRWLIGKAVSCLA